MREPLAQGRYMKVKWPGVEPTTYYTTIPHRCHNSGEIRHNTHRRYLVSANDKQKVAYNNDDSGVAQW